MKTQTIRCPECKNEIPFNDAIKAHVDFVLASEAKKQDSELSKRAAELSVKEARLQKAQLDIASQVKQEVEKEKSSIRNRLRAEILEEKGLEIKDLSDQISRKDFLLSERTKEEVELRKRVREAEEKAVMFELEIEKRVDSERNRGIEEGLKKATQEYKKRDDEREFLITGLRQQLIELKRKVEQGSQQIQGEVLELELEALLHLNFPDDSIVPIAKGVKGADVLHRVIAGSDVVCGSIQYETKRAKVFNKAWIEKLKEDVRESEATIGVLVTDVMPKGQKLICQMDGIWVVEPTAVLGIAMVLRNGIKEIHSHQIVASGIESKSEILYRYLTGTKFKQRIEAIVEAFGSMRQDLDKEKRVFLKNLQVRERQIETVINNTVGIYGDVQGVVGLKKLQIEALEVQEAVAIPTRDGATAND